MNYITQVLVSYFSVFFTSITFVTALVLWQVGGWKLDEAILQSILFINIGIRGVIAFLGNWVPAFSEGIAEEYGWEKENTYQKEIAASDGAFACLGLLSPFFYGNYWIATILGCSLTWILSEIANFESIYRKRRHPEIVKDGYAVSVPVFVGMHIDVVMALFSVGMVIYWFINK